MRDFTGKGFTRDSIAYGGFKDVPRQVTLVIRNSGEEAARVQVTATLHDTYHDNRQIQCEKSLKPGEEGAFVLDAPAKKWIRHLALTGGTKGAGLRLEQVGVALIPRNALDSR